MKSHGAGASSRLASFFLKIILSKICHLDLFSPDCIKCNQIRRRSLPRKSSIKGALALISVHSCLFSVCEQWKQCYDNFYRWQISLSKCKTAFFLLWFSKNDCSHDEQDISVMWLIKMCNPQFRQMKVNKWKLFLATLVALHFTPVSKWVSHWLGRVSD